MSREQMMTVLALVGSLLDDEARFKLLEELMDSYTWQHPPDDPDLQDALHGRTL